QPSATSFLDRVPRRPLARAEPDRAGLVCSIQECNIDPNRLAQHLRACGAQRFLAFTALQEVRGPGVLLGVGEADLAILEPPPDQGIETTAEQFRLTEDRRFDGGKARVFLRLFNRLRRFARL